MKKDKHIVSTLVSGGSAIAGAIAGEVIGGPIGGLAGAAAGTAIASVIEWGASEIATRMLSKSEREKVTTVYEYAKQLICEKLEEGKLLRSDDFFSQQFSNRATAEELLEGVLFAAQRECEEKKLPYLAKLYANICFEETIDRATANMLIKQVEGLTYHQLVIMRVVGWMQTVAPDNIHAKPSYKTVEGMGKITVATEIFDLLRKSLLYSEGDVLGAGSLTPANLRIAGHGAHLFNLLELSKMKIDQEFAGDIIDLLIEVK